MVTIGFRPVDGIFEYQLDGQVFTEKIWPTKVYDLRSTTDGDIVAYYTGQLVIAKWDACQKKMSIPVSEEPSAVVIIGIYQNGVFIAIVYPNHTKICYSTIPCTCITTDIDLGISPNYYTSRIANLQFRVFSGDKYATFDLDRWRVIKIGNTMIDYHIDDQIVSIAGKLTNLATGTDVDIRPISANCAILKYPGGAMLLHKTDTYQLIGFVTDSTFDYKKLIELDNAGLISYDRLPNSIVVNLRWQ